MEDKTATKTRTVKRLKIRQVNYERIEELLELYTSIGKPREIRNLIVEECQGLIDYCSMNFPLFKEQNDDMIQQGELGLIRAIEECNPSMFYRFKDHATKYILGEMRVYVNEISKGFNFVSLKKLLTYNQGNNPPDDLSLRKIFKSSAIDFYVTIEGDDDLNETFHHFDILTRSILVMKFLLRDTVEEIANAFRISVATVKEKIIDALSEMRAIFQKVYF